MAIVIEQPTLAEGSTKELLLALYARTLGASSVPIPDIFQACYYRPVQGITIPSSVFYAMNSLEENPRFPGFINTTFNELTAYGYLIHDQNWVSIFDAHEVTKEFRFSSRSFERG